MVELLYLSHNRRDFTRQSAMTLLANTNWRLVSRVWCIDDCSSDGAEHWFSKLVLGIPEYVETHFEMKRRFGGPVAAMNHALAMKPVGKYFAKVDNDTIVPRGWLDRSIEVLEDNPELDFLGIEAMFLSTVDEPPPARYGFRENPHIGGIGVMRRNAFETLPTPNGLFGFTEWQHRHPEVKKGFIYPSLPVFLLNLRPDEPWKTLSTQYEAAGWQRPFPKYDAEKHAKLWSWWRPW